MEASSLAAIPPCPIRVEGRLERPARWSWLVKWALALPHVVVLAGLGLAFLASSTASFVLVAFTGRYPRRVSRVPLTLVPGRPAGVKLRHCRRRAATAGSIEQLLSRRHGSLLRELGLTVQLYRPRSSPPTRRSMSSNNPRTATATTHYRTLTKEQPAATARCVANRSRDPGRDGDS
jgi:hypothetical protein